MAASAVILAIVLPIARPYLDILDLFTLDAPPQFDENRRGVFTSAIEEQDRQRSLDFTPAEGDEYATILIPTAGIEVSVYYGDSPIELRKGVGTYMGTWVPGQGHTVLLAGHNNNYFRTLPQANVGDIVTIRTNYGVFHYRITGSQVTRFDDTSAYDLTKAEENLIMYTCDNSTVFGATPWRLFVYAEYLPDAGDSSPTEAP
ncbi:MAG: class D sortase [Clostridiales Family XIII bacterium]|nr:class D sortase [Clostridiales Family XIII bacterium]